ncbi:Uncharacterised protein [Vibrio cholerae]|nr:Uncharacterised protein [Vibrio cholerae]
MVTSTLSSSAAIVVKKGGVNGENLRVVCSSFLDFSVRNSQFSA